MVVQVDVLGAKDDVVIIVLDIGKTVKELAPVMIEYHRNGASDYFVKLLLLLDVYRLYQVPDRLGTVGKAVMRHKGIEKVQDFLFDRNAESYYIHTNKVKPEIWNYDYLPVLRAYIVF